MFVDPEGSVPLNAKSLFQCNFSKYKRNVYSKKLIGMLLYGRIL